MTRKTKLAAVILLAAAPLMTGCLASELTSPPPTAGDVGAKREALAKARAELESEHRRANLSVDQIEQTRRKEAEVDAEIAALNRQLTAFETERAALSVLERDQRATAAQRERVKRLEREIKVLKSLISETAR